MRTFLKPLKILVLAAATVVLLTGADYYAAKRIIGATTSADDFGAAGDGTKDDTVALQAAMDATPSRGTLILTAGKNYKITGTLTRTNTQGPINIVSLGGQYGGATITEATANTTALSITVNESSVISEQDNASLLRGIRFNGPSGNTSGDAIYCTAAIHLDFVSTYDFYNGLELAASTSPTTGPYFMHVENSMFTRAVNAGVYSATGPNHNMTFKTTRFEACGYGVFVSSSISDTQRFSMSDGCTVELSTIAGVWLDGVNAAYIGQTYFEQQANNVPDVKIGANYTSKDVTLDGNWFTAYPGVHLWHIDADKVNGLTIRGCTLNGSGATGGDIKKTTNSTRVFINNSTYSTTSGFVSGNVFPLFFESQGDALGNGVGLTMGNSFGGSDSGFNISVDQTYSKGLNFAEIGVADGRLFIKRGGNVGVGTTNPTQNFQVGDGVTGLETIDANAPAGAIAEFSLSKAGTQKWQLYVPPSSNDLRFFDSADRVTLTSSTLTLGSGVQLNTTSGGSTTISTGVGSVKMSTGNAATNAAWIPMQYNGTTYYVPAFTTNAP